MEPKHHHHYHHCHHCPLSSPSPKLFVIIIITTIITTSISTKTFHHHHHNGHNDYSLSSPPSPSPLSPSLWFKHNHNNHNQLQPGRNYSVAVRSVSNGMESLARRVFVATSEKCQSRIELIEMLYFQDRLSRSSRLCDRFRGASTSRGERT